MYMGQVYPAFGCQLKFLGNLSSDPSTFPAALARGPPTSFKSGRVLHGLTPIPTALPKLYKTSPKIRFVKSRPDGA